MYDHTPFRLCYDPCDRLETVDRFDRRVVLHHITYHIPSYHIVLKLKNENEIYGFLRHAYFTVPVIYPKKVVSYAYQIPGILLPSVEDIFASDPLSDILLFKRVERSSPSNN